ncbi:hypothetical protein BH10BAC6_BH10BAC6_12840 [soil metagenome]
MEFLRTLSGRSVVYFAVVAALLLACSIPVSYVIINKLFTDDVDETNELRARDFIQYRLPGIHTTDIDLVNRIQHTIQIAPDQHHLSSVAIHDTTIYDSVAHEYEPYRVRSERILIDGSEFVLMTRGDLVEANDLIASIVLQNTFIFMGLLVCMVVVTLVLNKLLWKPFYQILKTITLVDLRRHSLPTLPESNLKEFQDLRSTLEHLLSVSKVSFDQQREFADNAAHELRNPLAVFRSQIDTLIQEPDLSVMQAASIQQLDKSVNRLSRIVNNLLLISNIHHGVDLAEERLNVVDVVVESIALIQPHLQDRHITVTQEIVAWPVVVANRGLFEIAVNNLLANATTHNQDHGVITVRVDKDRLVIANTATTPALDPMVVFRRFSRSAPGATSLGLGLSIANSIALRYGWLLHYDFSEQLHVFTLDLQRLSEVSPESLQK